MILDRGHRRWLRFSVVFLVVSLVLYTWYARATPGGPYGGSFPGLGFGIVGTAFILFAALLGVRKRRPHYRWGRASWWLKGHLWFGALSLPLVLFHGGFEFGGALTQVLMWIFILVFATGLLGLGLQQFLPRLMTKNVPQETVYEQIDHVRQQLFAEAEELAKGGAKRAKAVPRAKAGGKVQGRVVESRAVESDDESAPARDERAPIRRFVDDHVRTFFAAKGFFSSPMRARPRRAAMFEELRRRTDPKLHAVTHDIEALCEQRAQLEIQRKLHLWLHAWLLVHVPLSWTMVFLTAVHACMALYY